MDKADVLVPAPRSLRRLDSTVRVAGATVAAPDGAEAAKAVLAARLRAADGDGLTVRLERGADGPPESYWLRADGDGVVIRGDESGLYYGAQTLAALVDRRHEIGAVEIEDGPALAYRAMHIDFRSNCLMPTVEYLREMLVTLAAHKINVAIVEWEDKFPYVSHPAIPAAEALTREQVQELLELAAAHRIQLVPLLQGLGHVEYILKHQRYARLREAAADISQFCPCEPATREIVCELMDELFDANPAAQFVHLGGDETWLLGSCARCSAKVNEKGLLALYVDHIGALCRHALERGKTPLIWDDIVIGRRIESLPDGRWPEHELAALEALPRETRMVYWDYRTTTPDGFDRFADYERHGFRVWVAPTTRSSDMVPDYAEHFPNIVASVEAGVANGAEGMLLTSWAWKNLPVELTWHGILCAADRAWSGCGGERHALERRLAAAYFDADVPEFVEAIYLLSYNYRRSPFRRANGEPVLSSALSRNPGHEYAIPDAAAVRERAERAVELLRVALSRAQRHRDVLETWMAGGRLVGHAARKQLLFEEFDAVLAQPIRQLDRSALASLREQFEDLAVEREAVADDWSAALTRNNVASTVQQDRLLRFAGERARTIYAIEQLRVFESAEGRLLWR